ncbi:MAG TPA: universal stress protein [Casimicrobiaceae bacterium]|nr:universal stress protein [Casimicrobiaceae bacterium]
MALKSILVHLDRSKHCRQRLDAAMRLAVDFRAQLVGTYLVAGIELGPSIARLLPQDLVERRLRELGDAERESEQLFREAAATARVAAEWRAPAGAPFDAAVAHGRCADLVVLGQSNAEDPESVFVDELIATTILSTARPTLIVPHIGPRPTLGANVLVAWDGGREASRAIADSLPFLERAKSVTVITVNPESGGRAVDSPAIARLAGYLAAHGVTPVVDRDSVSDIAIGERLLSRAADLSSDLIVMGGYAHARLRELVLGGVTRTMLERMTVPVLMSH